jgi:hypothetical protein
MATKVIGIPQAGQYSALWGLKPQWWDPNDTANPPSDVRDPNHTNAFWAGLDDPRWAGSFQKSYGNGGSTIQHNFAEQVLFRALQFKSGADSYLYLSWNVKVDPDNSLSDQDYVWVGFNPGFNPTTPAIPSTSQLTPNADAPAVLIQIALDNTNAGMGTREGPVAGPQGNPGIYGNYSLTAFQNTGGVNPANWSVVPTPELNTWTWLTQYTRVWKIGGTNNTKWAIQMVVPVTATLDLSKGLKLGNLFGICYFVHVYSTTLGSIPYKWPTSIADTIGDTTMPDPTTFPLCTLDINTLLASTNPGGQTPNGYARDLTGIILPEDHVGTHSVIDPNSNLENPQLIKYTAGSTTRFFARPVNNDPNLVIPAGKIDVTFSLANWGSTTQWTPITGSTIPHAQILPGEEHEIKMDWTANQTDENFYKNHIHQCMLVTLSTSMPDLTFVNASAARNMDFVPVSKFSRSAEISIRGLQPFSSQPRDVYLFVETVNMPTKADSEIIKRNTIVNEFMKSLRDKHGDDGGVLAAGSSNVQFREIIKDMPTYRVHVYSDTGRRVTIGGKSRPVLEPQSSFGYYVWHEGSLYGWETRLYGAEKIAENLYHVRVPNNGAVSVETTIQARESSSETPLPEDGSVGCLIALAAWLDTQGPVGRTAAALVRLLIQLVGQTSP